MNMCASYRVKRGHILCAGLCRITAQIIGGALLFEVGDKKANLTRAVLRDLQTKQSFFFTKY